MVSKVRNMQDRPEEVTSSGILENADKKSIDLVSIILSKTEEQPFTEDVWECTRLKISFKIRNITGNEYQKINDEATKWITHNNQLQRQNDQRKFSTLLITTGTVDPSFTDIRIIKKYGTPDIAVHTLLYPGEILSLGGKILEISGFEDEIKDPGSVIKKLKN